MTIFENFADKIRRNKKWFRGTMATLVVALVAILVTIMFLPDAKASAIEDDPVGKTLTYNIPAIVANHSGSSKVIEVEIDVTDPDYTYYIVGDGRIYTDVSIVVNYDLIVTKEVPIYLDNVHINMTSDVPVMKFTPSTNGNLKTDGNYKIIVKGDCSFTSSYAGATYPVVQVESVSARLYQLKNYRGEDVNNIENYYDMVTSEFLTKVEFTSYEFADNEAKSECSLTITTADGSYGAAIGTTAGNIDMTTQSVELAEGSGNIVKDFDDGSLSKLFGYKPLKPGVQALYGASGYTGDVTVSGALKLTITSNGSGACIGSGGNYVYGVTPKDAGKVTINGGTLYLDTKGVVTNVGTYPVPAIGGGFDTVEYGYGASGQVIINGGSVYVKDTGVQFGGDGQRPVNAKGEELYVFETDYVEDIDENGRLVLQSEKYEDKYYADITVNQKYVDVGLQYNSQDYLEILNFTYEGFGYGRDELGNNLYFYLPATPLCGLSFDEDSYFEDGIPEIEVWSKNTQLKEREGKYWLYGEGIVYLKNLPSYVNIDSFVVTDIETGVPTDYTSALQYDAGTGDYTVVLRILSNSKISIRYSTNISIDYNYGFVEGDVHNVVNNLPVKFEFGDNIVLEDSQISASGLIFDGWYSELTGQKITVINDNNIESIMDELGHIKLNAKWNVRVIYDFMEGTGEDIPQIFIPYGKQSEVVLTDVVPRLDYHIFEGWVIDGQLQQAGYVLTVTPLADVVIPASYLRNSFFVFIDASPKKFNDENVEVYVGLAGSAITDENNCVLKNPDGSYVTKEIDGITYYQAVVEDKTNVAIVITPKPGHIITGQNIIVTEGKGTQMIFGAVGSQDGGLLVQLTIDQDDVYISTNSEFELRKYNITFYDGMSERGGEQLWSEERFTYTIADLDKPLGEILGNKVNEIDGITNRFYVFKGWKDKLTGKLYTNEDALGENLGDVILVAQWEALEKYSVLVEVKDSKTGEVSENIFAVPYYMAEDGSLEVMYTENDIKYAKKNDKIRLVFYYYDEAGNVKQMDKGFKLDSMDIEYVKSDDSVVADKVKDGVDYFYYPEPKSQTGAKVTANVSVIEYSIVYWDTKGVEHDNATSYTFFDEVEFKELTDNVGWLLVKADYSDDNYDEVVTVPITKVEKGTVGNLILKADWSEYVEKTYKVLIDSLIEYGTVEIIEPVGKDSYYANETLMIKVTPHTGYKLKNNVIIYRQMQDVSLDTSLVTTFTTIRNNAMYGAVEIEGSDGVYMVDVPEMDIIISAVFEVETYKITYNEVDELKNDNVTTFTYFDTVELLPVEKDGYEFKGWVDADGNAISVIDKLSSDLSLTPVFEKIIVEEKPTETTTPPKVEKETTTEKPTETQETTKPHIVGGGNAYGSEVYTGDTSNVTRLVLICVAAVIVLFILVLSKGSKFDEEEEQKEDADKKDINTTNNQKV